MCANVGEEISLFTSVYSLMASLAERDNVGPNIIPAVRAKEHMMQVQRLDASTKRALVVFKREKS
jgi:hypothetical protein